jgi:hypothetical protein
MQQLHLHKAVTVCLLVHQSIHTAARNAAANKNINQKITRWATPNRFVFSGYIKRYTNMEAK